jgi:hypothetical protein
MPSQFPLVHETAGLARTASSTLVLGAVLCFVCGVPGCGKAGLNASGNDGGADASAAMLLRGVFKAYCAAARQCCAQAGISTAELSDCETQAPTHADLTRYVDEGEMIIDASAIPACEAAYKRAATSCTTAEIMTECRKVFVGLQGEDQPCSTVLSCKSTGDPQICLSVGTTWTPGSCKTIVHGKAGDRCGSTCWSSEDCSGDVSTTYSSEADVIYCFEADGLFCSGSPSTCVPLTATGGSCIIDSPSCGSLNYCDSSSTCKPAATRGQPCTSRSQCVGDLYCTSDKTCALWSNPFAEPVFACQGYPYRL